eukprot:TRINITY_DN39883_c0_g1_i1.p1 TRINITY_DN39883_c0_g1~~TRINITY_DN39883_c0_g1_i1.p1  ORF type:complete len:163 (+),score=12.67 TRINITY_DN39883_c0_g1_i1:42-530(+)
MCVVVSRVSVCLLVFFFLMIRRPPRSTQGVSSAASYVYKRQPSPISLHIGFFLLSFIFATVYCIFHFLCPICYFFCFNPLQNLLFPIHSLLFLFSSYSFFYSTFIYPNIQLIFSSYLFLIVQPVSYTHLRAHETSLHLVCRLLLEKKKYLFSHSSVTRPSPY